MSIRTFSQNYAVSEIPEELKKDVNAVVRNHSYEYLINSIDDVDIHSINAVTIFSRAGEEFSKLYVPYDKTSKVGNIKVKVFDENGKLAKTYSKKDFSDRSQSYGFELYVDSRVLVLDVPSSTGFPYTIELTYDEDTSNTAFLPTIQPYFGYNTSVEKTGVKFINKSGINLRKKISDTKYAKSELSGDDVNFSLYYSNIPAIKEEKFAPNPKTFFSKTEFSLDQFSLEGRKGSVSNWEDFGKWWYDQLLEPVSQITPEIEAEVKSLSLSGSTKDKVFTLYQYMQNKTRYVLISEGIGGWKPMPADEVRRKGYGDCKALSNYMRVLLKVAGITSYYSKIYMDDTPIVFDKSFPKLGGNHIVLYVPLEDGTGIWLENTSQKIAFNHLGYSTTDRNVIMIKENTAEIVDTPKSLAENNKEILRIKANISADNNLDVVSNFSYSGGLYDMSMSLLSLTPVEQKDALKHRYDNLQFSNIDLQNMTNDRTNGQINFDLNFKAANYSKSLGSDIYFRAIPFLDSDFYLENADRKLPIEIPFGFTDDYEIEYTIPETHKFSEAIAPVKIDSEFGSFSMEFIPQDKKLLIKRKFMLKKGIFSAEKITDYINFRKKTNKIDHTKILITKL